MRAQQADPAPGCRRIGRRVGGPGLVGVLVAMAAVTVPSAAQAAATQSFTTPGTSTYIVSVGVTQLSITAFGAAGGPWCANGGGGRGASVSGTFPVSPGEQLTVSVGGVGATCAATNAGGGGGGGYERWRRRRGRQFGLVCRCGRRRLGRQRRPGRGDARV